VSAGILVRRSSPPIAWILWILLAGVFLFGETLAILNRVDGPHTWEDFGWAFLPISFAMGSLGCLVLSRLLTHAVGWLLTVVGLLFVVSFTTTEYAYHTLVANPGSLPLGLEVTPIAWVGGTAFFLLASLLLLIFPDGRPLPGRWGWLVPIAIACTAMASLGEFIRPGPLDAPLEAWNNPTGVADAGAITDVFTAAGFLGLAFCGIAGASAVVIRFRQADGIQRHQLRWIAFGGVLFISCWLVAAFGGATDAISPPVRQFIITIGISTIPIAAGVAILRYRLYDIDWIIARALVYVPLTAALAGIHIALTGVLRAVLATGSGDDMTVAITTVIVVAGLSPIKDYLQGQVNAHFKEGRDAATFIGKLTTETESAVQILDTSAFLKHFLNRIVDILDARGALIRVDGSPLPRVLLAGGWHGEAALEIPLYHHEHPQGSLQIGARSDGRPYDPVEVRALTRAATAVAHLVFISRENDAIEETRHLALSEAESASD
jgi:hypothetical protein